MKRIVNQGVYAGIARYLTTAAAIISPMPAIDIPILSCPLLATEIKEKTT